MPLTKFQILAPSSSNIQAFDNMEKRGDWCVPLSVCKCGGRGTGAGGPG